MTNASKPLYNLPTDAVWLITGCSSGLGLSLAQLIAAHPTHRLVATARNATRLQPLLPSSPRVLVVELDVISPESITSALDTVLRHPKFGRIDVLVNNAGYGLSGDSETSLPHSAIAPHSSDAEHAKARKLMETNFWGVANLTLHAMRIMREDNAHAGSAGDGERGPQQQQQGGVIVQVTSMGGFVGYPGSAYYHAAKFAVEGFTESLSREVRPEWNIHFTIAEPAGIITNYATSSLVTLADHPAYAAPDCATRILAAYIDDPEVRKSWTKPENIAMAIYEVVSRGKTIPMRFPLSAVSWGVLRAEVDNMAREFDEIKELSLSVDTEEQAERVQEVKQLA